MVRLKLLQRKYYKLKCWFSFSTQSVKPKWERTKDTDDHMGWVFPASDTEEPGAEVDRLNGAKSIRDLYELASTNYSGKYTVPVCDLCVKPPFFLILMTHLCAEIF